MHRFKYDAEQPDLVRLPIESEPELTREVALTVQRSLQQIIPFSRDEWSTDAYTHLIGRDLAQGGAAVQRLYLVPHRDVIPQLVAAQISADRARGVVARSIAISRIQGPHPTLKSSWLVDDEAVVFEAEATGQSRGWLVTTNEQALAEFRSDWQSLWHQAGQTAEPTTSVSLDEPLALSADLVARVSRDLCGSDHVDRQSCAWYHGVWQYLRIIDVVSTPTWHDEFYGTAFRANLATHEDARNPRVLICGTADYSLLAYVLAAAESRRIEVQVSVLDQCPTPLLACRWYANRRNQKIDLIEKDVLDAQLGEFDRYDLITSDAFLTRFNANQARLILMRWKQWLNYSGRIVTTVRIHDPSDAVTESADRVDEFVNRATSRIRAWRLFLDVRPRALEQSARVYAERMRSNSLGDTASSIVTMFEECGFRIESAVPARVAGELGPTTYLRIVARIN